MFILLITTFLKVHIFNVIRHDASHSKLWPFTRCDTWSTSVVQLQSPTPHVPKICRPLSVILWTNLSQLSSAAVTHNCDDTPSPSCCLRLELEMMFSEGSRLAHPVVLGRMNWLTTDSRIAKASKQATVWRSDFPLLAPFIISQLVEILTFTPPSLDSILKMSYLQLVPRPCQKPDFSPAVTWLVWLSRTHCQWTLSPSSLFSKTLGSYLATSYFTHTGNYYD